MDSSPKKRRFQWWLWLLVLPVTAITALLLAAPWILPPLLEDQMTAQLQQAGFPNAKTEVKSLGWTGATLALSIDPTTGQDFPDIGIEYSPLDLLHMKVRRIVVHDAKAYLQINDQGKINIVGMNLPKTSDSNKKTAFAIPILPFSEVILENAFIQAETPQGPVTLQGNATINQSDRGLALEGLFKAEHALGILDITVSGGAQPQGSLEGRISWPPSDLAHSQAKLEGVAGTITFQQPENQSATVLADLTVQAVTPADAPVLFKNIQAKAQYQAGQDIPLTATINIASLQHTDDPPLLVPSRLSADLSVSQKQDINFSGKADVAIESLIFNFSGIHHMGTGQGKGKVTLEPATLSEFASLSAISPWLAAYLDKITGSFEGSSNLFWSDKGLNGTAKITLKDIHVAREEWSITGLTGTLTFGSLIPPSLPQKQTLTAKGIQVGAPLTNPRLQFTLSPKGQARIHTLETQWSGGAVAVAPFTTDIYKPGLSTTVSLKKIDLNQLLNLFNVEGLAATGVVTGSIPVRLVGDIIHLDDGVLEAEGPGTLQYDPSNPPSYLQGDAAGGAGILMQALTNFHYESLRASIKGTVGQDLTIGLRIRGANPNFYDGYPVSLNLELSGALDTILRRSLETYQIPDAMQKQLLEQQVR